MIAVIFEVVPNGGAMERYLDLAATLREELANLDGFISVERFQSLSDPNKLLSLSFFRDEAAVMEWRRRESHRSAQEAGKTEIFVSYRVRVATVLRDYGLDRAEALTERS